MRRMRVMVVHADPAELQRLCASLAKDRSIEICGKASDGLEAFRCAVTCRPDLIVCGILLPTLDGLSLMERLRRSSSPPGFILLTPLGSDTIARQAGMLGAEYILMTPFDPKRLIEIIHLSAESRASRLESARPSALNNAFRLLTEQEYASHTSGFRYLAAGMAMSAEDPSLLRSLNKALYRKIADAHHTSPACVERCIRHAVHSRCQRLGLPGATNGQVLEYLTKLLIQMEKR